MCKTHIVISSLLIIFLFIGIGCNSSAVNDENVISDITDDFAGNSINEDIHGVWVLEDYIQDVVKSKSPFYSSRLLTGLVCLVMDTSKLNGDSLTVAASLNNHEGDFFTIYFGEQERSGLLKTSIQDYDYPDNSAGIFIDEKEKKLTIVTSNQNGNIVSKRRYIRVKEKLTEDDISYAIDYVIDSLLFYERYKLIEGNYKQGSVEFSRDGDVFGLENYKRYYVITDFVVHADNNIDQIYFDLNTEQQTAFTFEFHNDSLLLYQILVDTLDPILHKGELKYTLVKQAD